MLLFIKHIDVEGPGTVETYFQRRGFSLKTIDLSRGDSLPPDFSDIEAVVVLGGPMNVYEEKEFNRQAEVIYRNFEKMMERP